MKKIVIPAVGVAMLVLASCQMPNASQITQKINEKLAKVDVMQEKINDLETKMDKMQQQIDDLEERVIVLETKLEQNNASARNSNTSSGSHKRSSGSAGTSHKKVKEKIR